MLINYLNLLDELSCNYSSVKIINIIQKILIKMYYKNIKVCKFERIVYHFIKKKI